MPAEDKPRKIRNIVGQEWYLVAEIVKKHGKELAERNDSWDKLATAIGQMVIDHPRHADALKDDRHKDRTKFLGWRPTPHRQAIYCAYTFFAKSSVRLLPKMIYKPRVEATPGGDGKVLTEQSVKKMFIAHEKDLLDKLAKIVRGGKPLPGKPKSKAKPADDEDEDDDEDEEAGY